MNTQQNKLLTFAFAFVPGAGQMYLGYMHRGVSIMTLFCCIIFSAAFLRLDLVIIFLPIIYAYSFFDTFRLARQTPEQAAANPDAYLANMKCFEIEHWKAVTIRWNKWLGWGSLLLGVYVIYMRFFSSIIYQVLDRLALWWAYPIVENWPMLLIAFLFIILGVRLLNTKKPDIEVAVPEIPEETGE